MLTSDPCRVSSFPLGLVCLPTLQSHSPRTPVRTHYLPDTLRRTGGTRLARGQLRAGGGGGNPLGHRAGGRCWLGIWDQLRVRTLRRVSAAPPWQLSLTRSLFGHLSCEININIIQKPKQVGLCMCLKQRFWKRGFQ